MKGHCSYINFEASRGNCMPSSWLHFRCWAQDRSSEMLMPRILKLLTLSIANPPMLLVCSLPISLFWCQKWVPWFVEVEWEVVGVAPVNQVFYLTLVHWLINTRDSHWSTHFLWHLASSFTTSSPDSKQSHNHSSAFPDRKVFQHGISSLIRVDHHLLDEGKMLQRFVHGEGIVISCTLPAGLNYRKRQHHCLFWL